MTNVQGAKPKSRSMRLFARDKDGVVYLEGRVDRRSEKDLVE